MHRFFLLFVLQFPFLLHAQADSPYGLKSGREWAWIGGSVAGLGLDHLMLAPRNKPFTPAQVALLDKSTISRFDRFATGHYSKNAKIASDVLLYGTPFMATALLLNKNIKGHAQTEGIILLESLLVSSSMVSMTKSLSRRARPFCYNEAVPMSEKLKRDARESFYSGHTAATAALCVAGASIWAKNNPDSRWKPALWTAAALIPVSTGILRVRAGKHFPTDILAGLAIGGLTGYLIPRWHQR